MKKLVVALIFLLALTSCQNKSNKVADSGVIAHDESQPVLMEYYADSTSIGRNGYNKVELSRYVVDNRYVVIKFFSKLPDNTWSLKQKFLYGKDFVSNCNMRVSDFSNDGLGDMTYVSDVAARGANIVRRLFIYNPDPDTLVCLKNSEEYPNMQYNGKLNCIDAFLMYGCCSTVFLRIQGDSLKLIASVEVCEDGMGMATVSAYDEFDNRKVVKEISNKKFDTYTRFESYEPLKPYEKE